MEMTDEQILYVANEVVTKLGWTVSLDRTKDVLAGSSPDTNGLAFEFNMERARTVARDASSGQEYRRWLEGMLVPMIGTMAATPSWEEAQSMLRVRLGHVKTATGMPDGGSEILHWPLPGAPDGFTLRRYVVLDFPHQVLFVSNTMVEAWDVEPQEVMERAYAVTKALCRTEDWQTEDDELYACIMGDYATSRLLFLQDTIPDWPSEGAIVAAPGREYALAFPLRGADSIKHLQLLLNIALEMFVHCRTENQYEYSPVPVWTDGETWEPLELRGGPGGISILAPGEHLRSALAKVFDAPVPDDLCFGLVPRTMLEGE